MVSLVSLEDARLFVNMSDIGQILNTPAKRLVTAFLHAHPYTYDHQSGLSKRFSVTAETLTPALDELTDAGVLIKMGHGNGALYALNTREGWLEAIDQYFSEQPHTSKLLARIFSPLS